MTARRGRGGPRWRAALLLAAVVAARSAGGDALVTEVIPAGYRSAEELASVLAPLVPAPGSVSGYAGQIIVRTTPQNLAEIRRVIWTLDRAPANLLVTVRHTLSAEVRRDLAEASLRVHGDGVRAGGAGSGARAAPRRGAVTAGVRVDRGTTTRRSDDAVAVRVLEGKEAFIRSGESVPVSDSRVVISGAGVAVGQATRYEEFGSGFYVRPRLGGDTVTLDIIPARRVRRGDGSAAVHEASTSVSGPLGRWMEIGGTGESASHGRRGPASTRTHTTRRDGRIFVKVERLD